MSATGSFARVTSDRWCSRAVDAGYDVEAGRLPAGEAAWAMLLIGQTPMAGAEPAKQTTPGPRPPVPLEMATPVELATAPTEPPNPTEDCEVIKKLWTLRRLEAAPPPGEGESLRC